MKLIYVSVELIFGNLGKHMMQDMRLFPSPFVNVKCNDKYGSTFFVPGTRLSHPTGYWHYLFSLLFFVCGRPRISQITSTLMPSLKSHRFKRGLSKLQPKWKNEQAGKSFYMFTLGAVFMFSSFAAPFWTMWVSILNPFFFFKSFSVNLAIT